MSGRDGWDLIFSIFGKDKNDKYNSFSYGRKYRVEN